MKTTALAIALGGVGLLQVSFLPPFFAVSWLFPVILALSAFTVPVASGVIGALLGGLMLDVYSPLPFGFWMMLAFSVFVVSRYCIQTYVRIPQQA